MLMKTHELIDNRDEASMLLKGKEKDARSSIGVIWNGISFEKMGIPTRGAYIQTVFVGMYATTAEVLRSAQDDNERAQDDSREAFFRSL
jgi:hypothetical protein